MAGRIPGKLAHPPKGEEVVISGTYPFEITTKILHIMHLPLRTSRGIPKIEERSSALPKPSRKGRRCERRQPKMERNRRRHTERTRPNRTAGEVWRGILRDTPSTSQHHGLLGANPPRKGSRSCLRCRNEPWRTERVENRSLPGIDLHRKRKGLAVSKTGIQKLLRYWARSHLKGVGDPVLIVSLNF